MRSWGCWGQSQETSGNWQGTPRAGVIYHKAVRLLFLKHLNFLVWVSDGEWCDPNAYCSVIKLIIMGTSASPLDNGGIVVSGGLSN